MIIRNILSILLVGGAVMVLPACQSTSTTPTGGVFEQDIDAGAAKIMDFVLENTILKPITVRRPGIAIMSPDEMAYFRSENTRAWYYKPLNILVLSTEWRIENVMDRGFALHEGGHWIQLNQWPPVKFKCWAEREVEPYRLQILYLEQQGYKHGYTDKQIKELTTCR